MNLEDFDAGYVRFRFKLRTKVRQRVWRKLAKLLKDGIPMIAGLEEIRGLRRPKAAESIAIGEWIRSLENGAKLADAVRTWVSTEEYMLIMAGEQSGTLADTLTSVVTVAKAKSQIQGAVIGGIAYPAFILILAFVMLYYFGFKIIPAFTKVARGDSWTGVSRVMIDMSVFVRAWLPALIVGFCAGVVAFFYSLANWNSPVRVALDRFAPYSIYRVMQGSSWLIALAALVQAGVRLEVAIQQLGDGASAWARVRMDGALAGLRSGRNLGDSLERTGFEFPDREINADIRVYSTKSGFQEALRLIGNEWITESVERIQSLMGVVFIVTMLVVGGFILFLVAGLMGMMLQLAQIMQRSAI